MKSLVLGPVHTNPDVYSQKKCASAKHSRIFFASPHENAEHDLSAIKAFMN